MIITYKFKLYKTKRQKDLHKRVNVACGVYNHCIALHKRYYGIYGKYLGKYRLQKHLTKVKKRKVWWNEVGSQAIQDITDRIDRGYNLFFKNIKENITCSPPTFKKKRNYRSFTLKQAGWKVDGNRLRLGKQNFKFSHSRDLKGLIKTVTLKRDKLGDFYVYFVCDVENQSNQVTSGKSVGLDFGLKTFLTTQDGEEFQSLEFLKRSLAAVRKGHRRLSSKEKGSNNRKKARLSLARVYKKVTNCRLDFHHKLARELANSYGNIFIEDLDLEEMKKSWGRKVSDLGFYSFTRILESHCLKAGSILTKIPRYFPSSKTCSECQYVYEGLTLRDRTWVCSNCGTCHQRDVNAARNIFRVGQEMLKSKNTNDRALSFSGKDVRGEKSSCFCRC